MGEARKIGILTSGGDCAGLNAVIRAVVKRAVEGLGWRVVGIEDGTQGLMDNPPRVRPLGARLFSGELLRQGGTMLGTVNKGDPFRFPMPDGTTADRSGEIIAALRGLEIDALISIGGDGSMRILHRLAVQGGFQFIGVPKTIDNDVAYTDHAVGFMTAVDTAVDALDRLQPTAASHQRVMILEVMGRDVGHVALNAGIAGGADVILIPEIPYDIDKVAAKINAVRDRGRHHALVVVSEAVKTAGGETIAATGGSGENDRYGGVGHHLGAAIAEKTGADIRVTVLGYVQRGGSPTMRDRVLASAFGTAAVDLVAAGETLKMVAWQNRDVAAVPLKQVTDAGAWPVNVNGTLVRTARGLGISFGD